MLVMCCLLSSGATHMRPIFFAAILALAAVPVVAADAHASVSTKIKTTTYPISGKSGVDLLDAMDRRGPKHGFLTHAIAQTSYTIKWDVDWKESDGSCRVGNAAATLSITYTYPAVKGTMSPALKRRWQRFMAGVHTHEQTHGRIARQMIDVAEKSLSGLSNKNDPHCRKTQAELKKRIALTYAKYEARQIEFDRVEHAEGGNVEGLVSLLGRAK
jgi:predicted secreted Zn-dependent protease